MDNPAPPPVSATLAARIAWMRAPVRLTPGYLPWWLRRILEIALHAFLCRMQQRFLELMELHRQGKLAPWPEPEEEPDAPRISRYKAKVTPSAPKGSTGATHAHTAAAVEPETACAADVAALTGRQDRVVLHPAWPRRAVARVARAKLRPLVRERTQWVERCRPGLVCCAAETRRENCV